MICALCKNDKELRKSHIIPEFLFKSCYDMKHRFVKLSLDENTPQGYVQQGMREKLLCDECEEKLSYYEKYASELFLGKIVINWERLIESENYFRLHGLDYKRLKIFGLSIVWRAGVSTHPMFKNVNLGPHEEELRLLLYNEDPGHPQKYGFILEMLVSEDFDPAALMLEPTHERFLGYHAYKFVFGGLIWVFIISKQDFPIALPPLYLNEKGEMITKIVRLRDVEFINETLKDYSLKRQKLIERIN